MEEDSAAKAPNTRLRRRLSVERSEDVNSPATPTKKRGGRLASKPQLELIDENSGSTSNKTTKSAIKELAEVTNEKPLTPSRRSTRIKSNTSIVSETTQSYESPRAKRAARRASQVGSDNDTTVTLTPVRQTRRTRKDSTSSNDKLEATLSSKSANITEVIIEEDSNNHYSNISKTTNDTSNQPLRKSPRSKGKQKDNEQNSADQSCENLNTTRNNASNELNIGNDSMTTQNNAVVIRNKNKISNKNSKNLSDISINLINKLDDNQKQKVCSYANKSMTALTNPSSFKAERQRTKSLIVISKSDITDHTFFSDNEQTKKKVKKDKSSNDVFKDINVKQDKIHKTNFEIVHSEINKKPMSEDPNDMSFESTSKEVRNVNDLKESIENINIEETDTISKNASHSSLQSSALLGESPTGTRSKVSNKTFDSEDQCVPIVESIENCEIDNLNSLILNNSNNKITEGNSICLNKKENVSKNDSSEPMDIDVTIPNNSLISESSQLNKSSDSHRKSNLQIKDLNKSSSNIDHKSSPSHSMQNLEKSETENKSTLIISQLKDISSTENNVSKSPRPYQEVLSKSTSAIANDNTTDKKKLSLDYSTSTPLQQKHLQKIGMQINTSLIEIYKKEMTNPNTSPRCPKNDHSKSTEITSSSKEESDTDNSSKIKSLLDTEADVASDDYESGDSQDEEERLYEAENEVLERGETLESEDDFSNDSDYEKDSFVASSNEEDFDLLSGSGDDLAMSDNELTMSKKSKKKYDDRKIKEQKKASKEMFEARHKLDTKKSKTKSSQTNSSDDAEDEVSGKRYKRQRINSSVEDSHDQSMANESIIKKKTKKRVLSESECNDSINKEQEITIYNNSVLEHDPLSANVKQEPKTPLKDINLSTVQIMDQIEEIDIQTDISFSKTNQTSDPLYTSMVDDESSSLSENSEIVNNYDSMLNQLNNNSNIQKTKKNKSLVLDESNLSNSQKPRRSKNIDTDLVDTSQSKVEKIDKMQSSSDSIDLQLLFSEDSRDCDSYKEQTQNPKSKVRNFDDDFIPLKRTPGKTDIRTDQDNEESTNSEIKFIIDTEGSKPNLDQLCTSSNSSTKKKSKKKSLNSSNSQELMRNDGMANVEDDDKPLEIPFKSSKKDQSALSAEQHKDFDIDSNTEQVTKSPKKQKKTIKVSAQTAPEDTPTEVITNKKKRKRKSSLNNDVEKNLIKESGDIAAAAETSLSTGREKKKRKITKNNSQEQSQDKAEYACEIKNNSGESNKQESLETLSSLGVTQGKKNKKRKLLEGDNESKITKKLKEDSFDTIHVPRLPATILNQLDDKRNKTIVDVKKSKVVSTTPFLVEETKRRKNKPSFYLEESVYLNDSNSQKKPKSSLKKPKVLPFVPTAVTSDCGFTTKFQINVIPQQVHFVAKSATASNFKNDHLYGNKIKRLGTYEMYKKRRSSKLSKF